MNARKSLFGSIATIVVVTIVVSAVLLAAPVVFPNTVVTPVEAGKNNCPDNVDDQTPKEGKGCINHQGTWQEVACPAIRNSHGVSEGHPWVDEVGKTNCGGAQPTATNVYVPPTYPPATATDLPPVTATSIVVISTNTPGTTFTQVPSLTPVGSPTIAWTPTLASSPTTVWTPTRTGGGFNPTPTAAFVGKVCLVSSSVAVDQANDSQGLSDIVIYDVDWASMKLVNPRNITVQYGLAFNSHMSIEPLSGCDGVMVRTTTELPYLWTIGIDGSNARVLVHNGEEVVGENPNWSVNGWIYFDVDQHIQYVSSDGKVLVDLGLVGSQPASSPDGLNVAYTNGDGNLSVADWEGKFDQPTEIECEDVTWKWDQSELYCSQADGLATVSFPNLEVTTVASWAKDITLDPESNQTALLVSTDKTGQSTLLMVENVNDLTNQGVIAPRAALPAIGGNGAGTLASVSNRNPDWWSPSRVTAQQFAMNLPSKVTVVAASTIAPTDVASAPTQSAPVTTPPSTTAQVGPLSPLGILVWVMFAAMIIMAGALIVLGTLYKRLALEVKNLKNEKAIAKSQNIGREIMGFKSLDEI